MQIFIKEGWMLNPKEKTVNSIIKAIERNDGECPCMNPGINHEERLCPCKSYREDDICHCNLYVRKN